MSDYGFSKPPYFIGKYFNNKGPIIMQQNYCSMVFNCDLGILQH